MRRIEIVVADGVALAAVVGVEVDHHGPALQALHRHVLHPQRLGRGGAARLHQGAGQGAGVLGVGRARHVGVAAVAVVERGLRRAVAVGIEQRAGVGEAVPLRGILQVQDGEVVVHDIGHARHLPLHPEQPVGRIAAQRGADHRRVPARVQHVAARIVERQREAERAPLPHLGDALPDLLGGRARSCARADRQARSRPTWSPRAASSSAWSPVGPGHRLRHGAPPTQSHLARIVVRGVPAVSWKSVDTRRRRAPLPAKSGERGFRAGLDPTVTGWRGASSRRGRAGRRRRAGSRRRRP